MLENKGLRVKAFAKTNDDTDLNAQRYVQLSQLRVTHFSILLLSH